MAVGDWSSVLCGSYRHHFIEWVDGQVIHLYGDCKCKSRASVRVDPEIIATGGRPKRLHAPGGAAAAERALSRVGKRGYDLIDGNCEHFAQWCVTGAQKSTQVATAAVGTGFGLVGGGAVSVGTIAAAGVPGLSAVGFSTGLASIGAVVGGGFVAGVVVTLAFPLVAALGVGFLALQAHNE